MKTRKEFVPKALREVCDWKEAIYREVKDLPPEEALHRILEKAQSAVRELGFAPGSPAATTALAEESVHYGRKKQ
jgi:hypothetical protein